MKLTIVFISLYICVDAIPRPDLPLTSEEITQEDEPQNKLMKVAHYESVEHESPWLDQQLLEITPLRPSKTYSPPVAFVVGTPTHKKNQKETSKLSKRAKIQKNPNISKKQKRKYPKQAKDSKKMGKKKDKDRFGLYTAAAYPSFQGHPVIPVIYPDVQPPHIHINPFVSESSEEILKHDQVKKKPRNNQRFRPKYDLKSTSESTEYSDDHYRRMRHKSRKSRPKQRNIKHTEKYNKKNSIETSSEDDFAEKSQKTKLNNHKKTQKFEKVKNGKDTKKHKELGEKVSNEIEELDNNSESYEFDKQSKIKEEKYHEKNLSESNISDEDENINKKNKKKSHVTNSKSGEEKKRRNEMLNASKSEEIDVKISLESEQSEEPMNQYKNDTSSEENGKNSHEVGNQNTQKLDKLKMDDVIEENHFEKRKKKLQLTDKNLKSGNPSNEKSEEESTNTSKDIRSGENISDQLNSEPDQEINPKELYLSSNSSHNYFNELRTVHRDGSVSKNNSQVNNELESPLPMLTPSWFQNNQLEHDRNSNSEEKLREEYNLNLKNIRNHQHINRKILNMDEIMNRYHKMDDNNKMKIEKSLNDKQNPDQLNKQDNNGEWLNKIDEIINMLRDEKYGKITEDPNNDGIFVTKHNPKTGKEDENSIFITKIVHTLDDKEDIPQKHIPKKNPKQIQHIYEIANHPKYNATFKHDKSIEKSLENFVNKTESFVDADDIVLSTEDTIPDIIPMDKLAYRPHFNNILASEEVLYRNLQNQHNLEDMINSYDQYADNLIPDEILRDYDDIIQKNNMPNDWIPDPLKELANYLPNTNEYDKEIIDKREDYKNNEEQPQKRNDSFVFNGKVDRIFVMNQDNTTKPDYLSYNDNQHDDLKKNEKEEDSAEDSSNILSLETNEYSKEYIKPPYYQDNQNLTFLQKTKAVDHNFDQIKQNLRDINLSKDGKITLHINDNIHNDKNENKHRIEIIHNHNEEDHSSSEIMTEILEDIEDLAENYGHDVKYVINDCDTTTKKNIEIIPANKTYNLSFLFNKR